MSNSNKYKSWKIILIGNLMVNLPITLVILLILFSVIILFGSSMMVPALLISTFIGWYLWAFLLEKWRLWGLRNNVEPERLYRLGKLGLINFYRYRIIKEEKE